MVVGVCAVDIDCGLVVFDSAAVVHCSVYDGCGEGVKEMNGYKQLTVRGCLVEAPLKPCPWCKKTPHLTMPLDDYRETKCGNHEMTWVWRVNCIDLECRVKPEVKVSIRKTSKTLLNRFLDKLDELYDRWNDNNPIKAYEMKVIDLRMIPNLGIAK